MTQASDIDQTIRLFYKGMLKNCTETIPLSAAWSICGNIQAERHSMMMLSWHDRTYCHSMTIFSFRD